MRTCAFVSFRLGMTDGVSVAAAAWQQCFQTLGWTTTTVAGEGPVDRIVSGLEIGAASGPDHRLLAKAVADADLVVAENILSIPLNMAASRVLGNVLRGRAAILHHHDPPWQRQRFATVAELPPDDPNWWHVTINHLTEEQFNQRGLAATTIYNGFDLDVADGDRDRVRRLLGVDDGQPLIAHPVRAVARKNIPTALAVTASVDGIYWLSGPAEEDYAPTLEALMAQPPCPVIRTPVEDLGSGLSIADLYAACDLVVFPSTWEGFGNPPIEAAIHHRPVVVGDYPVARELRRLGFWWLDPDDGTAIKEALAQPATELLTRNRELVEIHLSTQIITERVKRLLHTAGF